VYEYDLRGRKTYEGGATYPVRYTYDVFNVVTNVATYQNEELNQGGCLGFTYDENSRVLTQQINADKTDIAYSYDDKGMLTSKKLARGIIIKYFHDDWHNVTNIVYSDLTPSVYAEYDQIGRISCVHDASGRSTFFYDSFGQCVKEITPLSTIDRYYDAFGREAGYVHSSGSGTTNIYDEATGRLKHTSFDGNSFALNYVSGTDLEESLVGKDLKKIIRYEDNSDRVVEITYTNSCLISSRRYGYDARGNITSRTQLRTGYSERCDRFWSDSRNQLTNAVVETAVYSYCYDDSGNRKRGTECGVAIDYSVNNLNQYTSISSRDTGFWNPMYDSDGNQIFVKTKTGEWNVEYNGDNRPIKWSCGRTNIVFTYEVIAKPRR